MPNPHPFIRYLPLLLSFSAFAPIAAQGRKPVFRVSVQIDSVSFRDSTIRLGLSVRNSESSTVGLWGIFLETPAKVKRIDKPATTPGIAGADWFLLSERRGVPVAEWMLIANDNFRPGMRTPTLSFEAIGVADLVTYHAIYYARPPKSENPDEEPDSDPTLDHSVAGTTVGIAPAPTAASPDSLLRRLVRLLERSCRELGWISSVRTCMGLRNRLMATTASLNARNFSGARGQLRLFLGELQAQHGRGRGNPVSTSAFALLRSNGMYLLNRLAVPAAAAAPRM